MALTLLVLLLSDAVVAVAVTCHGMASAPGEEEDLSDIRYAADRWGTLRGRRREEDPLLLVWPLASQRALHGLQLRTAWRRDLGP